MEWLESRLPILRSARPFVPSSESFENAAGNNNGQQTGGEDDHAMMQTMCDLILGEIQIEIDRVQKEAERRRQEELRLTNQPDYSWLVDWRLRSKRPLGFRESSEIETLCTKIRPREWRRLLEEWRRRVRYVDTRDEVLEAFKNSVDFTVAKRMEQECRLESVDEHKQQHNGGIQEGQPISRRPQTALPRIPYPFQLNVLALTQLPRMEQDDLV